MLSDEADFRIHHICIIWVAILHRVAIVVLHKGLFQSASDSSLLRRPWGRRRSSTYLTIRHIMSKQTPEQASCHNRLRRVLSTQDDLVEIRQAASLRSCSTIQAGPIDLAGQIHPVRRFNRCDIGFEDRSIEWVEMVRENIHLRYGEVSSIDAICAINAKLMWSKLLDKLANLPRP